MSMRVKGYVRWREVTIGHKGCRKYWFLDDVTNLRAIGYVQYDKDVPKEFHYNVLGCNSQVPYYISLNIKDAKRKVIDLVEKLGYRLLTDEQCNLM